MLAMVCQSTPLRLTLHREQARSYIGYVVLLENKDRAMRALLAAGGGAERIVQRLAQHFRGAALDLFPAHERESRQGNSGQSGQSGH